MIVLYAGRRGCGKTTASVRDAYLFHRRGWRVVTNMESVSFADRVIGPEDLAGLFDTEPRKFVLLVDEIQTFIDSRRSGRKQNVTFAYFIQQIRKRGVVILATTQFPRRVDVAFREHVDVLARPRFYGSFPVVRVAYMDLTASDGVAYDDDETLPRRSVVFDPRPIYPLFDTGEVIKPSQPKGAKERDARDDDV